MNSQRDARKLLGLRETIQNRFQLQGVSVEMAFKALETLEAVYRTQIEEAQREARTYKVRFERAQKLFELQGNLIEDPSFCDCRVCGLRLPYTMAFFCQKCDDGVDYAICHECESELFVSAGGVERTQDVPRNVSSEKCKCGEYLSKSKD